MVVLICFNAARSWLQFTAYMSNIKAEKRAEAAEDAVFPCILKILPQFVFMKKDPIILGCEIVAGIAKVGALLAALETFGW
jgi:translation initiation factor 5B